MKHTAALLAIVLGLPLVTFAQTEQPAAGTSAERLGTVRFATSCSPSVEADFNRAVALLHSFEFRPAMETFNRVLDRDASCAIAYWGIALCHWGNPFAGIKSGDPLARGREATEKGLATGTPTARERAYVAAVAELFKQATAVPHRERTLAYARAMDALQRTFPEDIEARIFYALAVNQTALPTDKTYAAQLTAAGILEPLWKQYPDHPGLPHYIIHAYDHPPLAVKAIEAANRYAKIAPSAPHALHMPSHTFTRVGYWRQSAETNAASEQVAVKSNVLGEALHAMDYQEYAHLQMARDKEARAVLQRTPGVLAKLDVTAMGGAAPPAAGVYAAAAIPARYALERGAWAEAAALHAATSAYPYADAVTHFARALGAARGGTPAAARADLDQLAALRDKLGAMGDEYWRTQVDIQHRVAAAWVAFAEGRRSEAVQLLSAAADNEDATDKSAISPGPLAPARELLGEMLLETGNAREALVAFEATMKKEPGRFRGAFGAAKAAEAAGDATKAQKYYTTLLDIAGAADGVRPELDHARAFVKSGSSPRD
jgi:tetratricopeptide (TPR) repeat protein